MSEPTSKSYLPDDIEKAIKDTKQLWRARIGDVPALLENIVAGLERDIQAIEQDIQKQLDKESEITRSGLETMRQAGGNTTVVNNTNVNNTANTQTSSMTFPKSAKNNDNTYAATARYKQS